MARRFVFGIHGMLRSAVMSAAMCASAAACSADHGDSEPVAQKDQPVANGSVDTSDTYPAVVALAGPGNCGEFKFFCSGTLVSPKRVMTAAHCVENEVRGVPADEHLSPTQTS